MKLSPKCAVWLLPLVLTGCSIFHRNKPAQLPPLPPTIESTPAPEPTPAPAPTETTPPATTTGTPAPAPSPAPETKPQEQPKKTSKTPAKKKAAEKAGSSTAASPQQTPEQKPGVSAVGQLSTGDSSEQRREASDSLAATERGLNGINRSLNDQEQKTAEHIREYIKQARTALNSGDVDGARTLAAKAKLLLGELVR
jgi:outer membrane biosynthesis protein TonB